MKESRKSEWRQMLFGWLMFVPVLLFGLSFLLYGVFYSGESWFIRLLLLISALAIIAVPLYSTIFVFIPDAYKEMRNSNY